MTISESKIKTAVERAMKNVLHENRQDELVAFHGTTHSFDEFDTDFIGTGESTQVYGWGLYMTGVEETGRYYAAIVAKNQNRKRRDDIAIVMNNKIESSIKKPFKMFRAGDITFEQCKQLVIDNMKKNGVSDFFIEKYQQVNNVMDSRAFGAMALELATRAYKRFLYTVELPDDGFIDWNETNQRFIMEIYNRFSQVFGNLDVNTTKIKTFGDLYCQIVGGKQCKSLYKPKNIIIQPKTVSKFLQQLGYKGISVPIGNHHGGDNTGFNYVLFDSSFVKIIKKELI